MGTKSIILIALVFFVIGLFAFISSGKLKSPGRTAQYKRSKIMTDNEKEFFSRLIAAVPEHYVFPQVAMSAILESASKDRKQAHSDRLRIAQQRVDYVIVNANFEIVVVVELDDKTHSVEKDKARDARLTQVGIRTVRFQSRNKPTVETIRSLIPMPAITSVQPITQTVNPA